MKRTLALILSLVMCLGLLAGCGDKKTDDGQTDGKTLVVGTQNFDGKFSPFFYTNDYENQVMGMVFDGLFLVDREGSVVLKGIEGDVRPYNGTDYTYKGIADCDIVENSDGTVDYNITLKEGVKFSDGEEMTIDDVIFSYYVLLDPAYDGVSTLYSLPIKGLEAYRSGMDTVQNLILAAGPDAYAANDFYTEEQYNAYWTAFNAAGVKFAQEILDYVVASGSATADDSVAAQAGNWGFDLADDATVEDFWAAIVAKYGYDISDDGINAETAGTSISSFLEAELGDAYTDYTVAVQTGESAPNVAGIVKTGDYSMTVTLTEVNATAIYQLPVTVCPMHYYGETDKYDYDNNMFGFVKGDLSHVKSVTSTPIGSGPYTFESWSNGAVTLQKNPTYWKGEPKIDTVIWREMTDEDKIPGVVSGTSATTFEPTANVTRAQFVTMIAGLAGADVSGYASGPFDDVQAGSWYAPYVNWAAENGVVYGVSDTAFAPDAEISRQDMAAMLYRYAGQFGIQLGTGNPAITFTDEADIADYALPAVEALQRAGVISGMPDGSFRPRDTATREQACVMLCLL